MQPEFTIDSIELTLDGQTNRLRANANGRLRSRTGSDLTGTFNIPFTDEEQEELDALLEKVVSRARASFSDSTAK